MRSKSMNAQYLTARDVIQRYPQLSYDDDYEAVIDADAGILHADRCLQAIQVWCAKAWHKFRACCHVFMNIMEHKIIV